MWPWLLCSAPSRTRDGSGDNFWCEMKGYPVETATGEKTTWEHQTVLKQEHLSA